MEGLSPEEELWLREGVWVELGFWVGEGLLLALVFPLLDSFHVFGEVPLCLDTLHTWHLRVLINVVLCDPHDAILKILVKPLVS